MKTFSQVLLYAALTMALSFDASAYKIDLSDPSSLKPIYLPFSGPSQNNIDGLIDGYFSQNLPDNEPALAYKQNSDGSEEGALASSYSTKFWSDAAWTIMPSSSSPVLTGPIYLLVKDGNHTPYAYFFDLTSVWNGTSPLELYNFWPGQGSISHVGIYTTDGGTTLMLLGMALVGFGAARRFLRASLT